MVGKAIFLFVIATKFFSVFAQGYKKSNVSCYEELGETDSMKTIIECCSLCSVTDSCQGVSFENGICKTLKNVIIWGHKELEAWVEKSLLEPTGKNFTTYLFKEF